MAAIHIDETRWPIAVFTYIGVASPSEFEAYLARLEAMMARGQRCVVVVDATHSGVMPQYQRVTLAKWMREHDAAVRELLAGCAFVFSSPILRMVLHGLLLLYRLPAPHTVCGTVAEAIRWAEGRVRFRP